MILKDYSELTGQDWITVLKEGMDFRNPLVRKEVFLRFYGFHLKYKAHPGAVYYVMPYFSEKYNFDEEQKLWFAFINGATQNPLTTWVLFSHFPEFDKINLDEMENWHRKYWRNLDYDIDRRYQKGHFVEMVEDYKKNLNGRTQAEFFGELCQTDDPHKNFEKVWDTVINDFFMYGRLSTFSYVEYLKIMGVPVDCNSLFIYDKAGSKSHRNGLCRVFGRDEFDVWQKNEKLLPELQKGHTKEVMQWLEIKGAQLLEEAKERYKDEEFYEDVNYFTLESTLCCYKSWHRINRRYPNVYNDMFYQRIKKAEERDWRKIDGMDISFEDFWDARKKYLPKELRKEDNPNDPGLVKVKQNWYRKTGEVIMMEHHDPVFKNSFFEKWREKEIEWYGKSEVPELHPKKESSVEEWL